MLSVPITVLPHGLPVLPAYQTNASVGLDLPAAIPEKTKLEVYPNTTHLVPCGFCLAIPVGFNVEVRSRSGLAKEGLIVLNSPGTIDPDYRGEVMALLRNLGNRKLEIKRGDRIAQLVIVPAVQARLVPTKELPSTERDTGGFGSTGV